MDAAAGMEQLLRFPADDSPDVHLGYWMIRTAWAGPEQDAAPLLPVPGPGGPRSGHRSVDGTKLPHANRPLMRLE